MHADAKQDFHTTRFLWQPTSFKLSLNGMMLMLKASQEEPLEPAGLLYKG